MNACHAEENTKLNDCFYEKKDWRACKDEVSRMAPPMPPLKVVVRPACYMNILLGQTTDRKIDIQMEAFKECWKRQGNDNRTEAKDA